MRKRFGGCAAAVLFACIGTATPAHAAAITFYTTGTFGSGGSALVLGSGSDAVTLTFTGAGTVASPINSSTPNAIWFGDIVATGGGNRFVAPLAGETFTLSILQSVPDVGTGSVAGDLSGTIKYNTSNGANGLAIEFDAPFVTIGGITYSLLDAYTIVTPSRGGTTRITGSVSGEAASVPEPASTLLLGLGFLGSVAAVRRRRKTRA